MNNKSGDIYRFPLEHNMGYGYCQLCDFSDLSDLSGRLISVFKLIDNTAKISSSLDKIDKSSWLWGPVPLVNYPNIKGKGAWKLIGNGGTNPKKPPIFKDVRGNFTQKNWNEIGPWYKVYEFDNIGEDCNYEDVRNIEIPVLHNMKNIETKTTMLLLLKSNKDIQHYYNLSEFSYRNAFIQLVNTYFDKDIADKLLKLIA